MKNFKGKTIAISIAILLTISMSASIMLIPSAEAHTPPYYIVSYAYLTAAPQPVGIGQPMSVSIWVDYPLPGTTLLLSNIRRTGYALNITAPDGNVTTQTFATIDDPTGIQDHNLYSHRNRQLQIRFLLCWANIYLE